MKSMTSSSSNDNNGNNDNSKNSDNWLGFSLSPNSSEPAHHSPSNPTTFFTLPPNFNYQNIYYGGVEGVNGTGGFYSAFPIMPLKSDGSLCLIDSITRSQSQAQGMVGSTTPKLENFFGGVTMGTPDLDSSTMYYNQNYQIQPQHYQDYTGLYQTLQQQDQEAKIVADATGGLYQPTIGEGWISTNYNSGDGGGGGVGGGGGSLQSLSLSMSPGCSQSSSCVTVSQQQMTPAAANPTETHVVTDTKKRGSDKVDQIQHKQVVHRKSLDTFGQRTSQYRGVTRHRWTGRYEAHLWDNSCKKEGQTRKGRQVYLGGYDMEEKAARAYDLAALKYWGASTHINFPVENYAQDLEEMKNMSRQEYVAHLRRRSSGFSRGASVYRGVTRHHQHGRWQARIGRVAGNKDLYLGTFSTQEDAAEAYDVAAIKFRGVNAVTNFDISRYNVERIIESNTLLAGELARRTKQPVDPTNHIPSQPAHQTIVSNDYEATKGRSMLEWKMEQYDHNSTTGSGEEDTHSTKKNLPMVFGSKAVNAWIPTTSETAETTTTQVRSHIPIFAAWTDA